MKSLMLVCFCCCIAFSEMEIRPQLNVEDYWKNDTVYIGAEIVVVDSTKNVRVKYENAFGMRALGEVYFVNQNMPHFLFHNIHSRFPNEDTIVDIGKFSKGTKLTFFYMCTDTMQRWSRIKNKKLYTGKNRTNTDQYVSEYENSIYGKKWSAVSNNDKDVVLVGFSDYTLLGFNNLFFKVFNAEVLRE